MRKYKTIPELFNATQAGEKLNLSEQAVRYHARRDTIGYFLINSIYMFLQDDITRFRKGLPPVAQKAR